MAGAGSSAAQYAEVDPADRTLLGLPAVGRGFVFANFNKNEKLEPTMFAVWVAILRRVPSAVLWLLSPSQSAASTAQLARLLLEAAAAGVLPSRIVFAARFVHLVGPVKDHSAVGCPSVTSATSVS